MSTLTGNVYGLTTSPSANKVTFKYQSAPAVIGGSILSSIDDLIITPDPNGNFSTVLAYGDYKVYVGNVGTTKDIFTVSIPNDSSVYTFIQRVVSSVTVTPTAPAGGAQPTASTTVLGLVKITKDATNPKAAVGLFDVTDLTALKALATDSSSFTFARLSSPGSNKPSRYYWSTSSTATDDSATAATIIRPNDISVGNPGRWLIAPPISVAGGGTGAASASAARTNLSLLSQEEIWTLVANRRPRSGVVFDNGAAYRLTNGATGINLGLLDFSVAITYQKTDWTPAASDVWFTTHSTGNNTFRCGISATTGKVFLIFIDNTGATIFHEITPDVSLIDGETYHLVLTVARAGVATLYVNSVTDRDGDGTGCTVSVADGSAVNIGSGNSNPAQGAFAIDGKIFAMRVFSRILTLAEIQYMNKTGVPPYSETFGSLSSKYSSDFSAGVDGFSDSSATVAGNVDSIGGVNDTLSVTAAGTVARASKAAASRAIGKRLKLTYDVYIATANATGVKMLPGSGASGSNVTNVGFTTRQPATNTWVTYTEEIILTTAFTGLEFQLLTTGGSVVVTTGDKFYVKNVILEYPGCIADWDFLDADPQISTALLDRAGAYDFTVAAVAYQDQVKKQLNTEKISVGTGGTVLKKQLSATATLDFPSIAANGGQQSLTITVTGAAVGDEVGHGPPAAPTAGITFMAFVSAADTVTVRATNHTTGAIDPASATHRVTVRGY